MNFSPELSTGTAIGLTLLAAFLWGSWLISLKYLGDYPLDAYVVTLLTTSVVFVWAVGFAIDGPALLGDMREVFLRDPSRLGVTLACGALYVNGMRLSLVVQRSIGLSLAQPIQSSIIILVGTLISGLIGGIPAGVSLAWILVACLFLIGAVTASMLAGHFNVQSQNRAALAANLPVMSRAALWRSLWLSLLASLFIPAYPLGLSYGLRSPTQPEGLAVLPFMALLATGAFLGALASSGVILTRRRQWGRLFRASVYIHKFGIVSGLFHYGGNILHTYGAAFLSTVIAWPLGLTSGLWTQIWGLAYGEFRGAPRIAFLALFTAVGLYLAGALLIALTLSR